MVNLRALFSALLFLFLFSNVSSTNAQHMTICGRIYGQSGPIEGANVYLQDSDHHILTDSIGTFCLKNISAGKYELIVSHIGYETYSQKIDLSGQKQQSNLKITLEELTNQLESVVISGTMKPVSKLESPVPVEVYNASYFACNPTPSVFEALQNINGVRPQVNCNICNTGDIHINGLEGPYTMILIDGMPIVSGLSTVYGLNGIPQALIDRIEIVKGPASTLYGSEAVGGLINVITVNPKATKNKLSIDAMGTTWGEYNVDAAGTWSVGNQTQSILGVNYFNFNQPIDRNNDLFTDVTLQNRFSIFNKWQLNGPDGERASLAARYIYEDRWGGELNWQKSHRGGNEVYGESIYTKRWELMGTWRLPMKEKIKLNYSLNHHDQNSVYGETVYLANQLTGFAQMIWDKTYRRHDILAGLTYRYTHYDDNTPATGASNYFVNHTHLPGVFVQDEIGFNKLKVLLGMRYDYHIVHGSIFTPRLNLKWSNSDNTLVTRLGLGNGYRVANIFTEDHAALTGSRKVTFLEDLRPERSNNITLNVIHKIPLSSNQSVLLDASLFYTHFSNKIIADYEADPLKIIYDNLSGYAVSRGASLNVSTTLWHALDINIGGTLLDVFSVEDGQKQSQFFTETFSGTWTISWRNKRNKWVIDYTGNVYSPMHLPLLNATDPRPDRSPWWSIQNIQLSKSLSPRIEIYGGIKNILNWTPRKLQPFLIARAHDPFNKLVTYDAAGQVVATPENPYGLVFDPTYVFAPNQGIRGFLGVRCKLK